MEVTTINKAAITLELEQLVKSKSNPRKNFDEKKLNELAESIKQHGILQPLLVRPFKGNVPVDSKQIFEVVCGERRFRAAKLAGLTTIPVTIKELNDEQVEEIQLIENIQREDITPMEEAESLLKLQKAGKSNVEISKHIGKSPAYVALTVQLNTLHDKYKESFKKGNIDKDTALQICRLSPYDQKSLFNTSGANPGNWQIKSYSADLSKAPFDINDPELNKEMGPCGTCQFNSKNSLLFPEAGDKPICGNKKCFAGKSKKAFEVEFKNAKENPEVLLIMDHHGRVGDKFHKELEKEHRLYNLSDVAIITPSKKDIEAGKVLKGFFIEGDRMGKWCYVSKYKKEAGSKSGSSKSANERIKEGKATALDITEEINRLKEREKRSHELDHIKIQKEVVGAVSKNNAFRKPGVPDQGTVDRAALVYVLLQHVNVNIDDDSICDLLKIPVPGYGDENELDIQKAINAYGKVNDNQLAFIIRCIFNEKYGRAEAIQSVGIGDSIFYDIAKYLGVDTKAITIKQQEEADARNTKVKARISDLLKLAKEKKPAAAKKASVKKKVKAKAKA